jgi:hypothetical protein
MALPRPQTIPVFLLVKTAFQVLWQQRDDALRLGFIPTLVCFGALAYSETAMIAILQQMQAGQDQFSPNDSLTLMASALVSLLALAVLVANWLRFTLLGPMGAIGLGLGVGRPHLGFIAACVVLLAASGIAFAVVSMPLLFLSGVVKGIGFTVAFVAVLIGVARLLPLAVGQAIGQPLTFQQAWHASRGNGVALACSLILVLLPLWIVAIVLSNLLFAIGFGQLAPLAMLFIGTVFQSAGVILQAIVLAAAFRQLVGIRA